jgi:hypothetical protein
MENRAADTIRKSWSVGVIAVLAENVQRSTPNARC